MSVIVTVSVLIIAVVSLLVLIALVVFVVGIYNSLVSMNVNIDKAGSNIDVLTKQRFDEIPNLVEVCKGYMKHEKETLEGVIAARNFFLNSKEVYDKVKADVVLEKALTSLFALSENYPNLKANEEFIHLQQRVTALENSIAERREFYNYTVALFNTRIQQIPDIVVARCLNYKPKQMFHSDIGDFRASGIYFKRG